MIAISWAQGFEIPALAFARAHGLPIINELQPWRGLCFELSAGGWLLKDLGGEMGTPFDLEFSSRHASAGRDPLLKAMGKCHTVLDLTAGWGSDALHIVASGRTVVAVERNPVVYQLLRQAHQRMPDFRLSRDLEFLHLDASAKDFSQRLAACLGENANFELVYLDPMFAHGGKGSARAKKPMRLMQRLTEAPSEYNEARLLDNALGIAGRRVVVKRALKAPCLDERKPQGSIRSKLLRFDLYQA